MQQNLQQNPELKKLQELVASYAGPGIGTGNQKWSLRLYPERLRVRVGNLVSFISGTEMKGFVSELPADRLKKLVKAVEALASAGSAIL